LGDEEEEGHNDPGFEGAVRVGKGIAEDEEADNHEEVYYGGGVTFNVEDKVECVAGRLKEILAGTLKNGREVWWSLPSWSGREIGERTRSTYNCYNYYE
jgi:hypothetical protein